MTTQHKILILKMFLKTTRVSSSFCLSTGRFLGCSWDSAPTTLQDAISSLAVRFLGATPRSCVCETTLLSSFPSSGHGTAISLGA